MGGGGKPHIPKAEPISPAPTFRTQDEMQRAQEEARRRAKRTGRESTILAGQMMTRRGADYELKSLLG